MTIKIKDQECKIKYTLRGFFIYERVTGGPFTAGALMNEYILLYSLLLACNEDFTMSFDQFIDACDEDNEIFRAFREWFVSILKQMALTNPSGEEGEESKKKV